MNIFYAKSNGETISEHTEKVIRSFYTLNKKLLFNEFEKNIICKILEYHDKGKINPEFQNRMSKMLGINSYFDWKKGKVPHEWISPAFITQEEEKKIKENLKKMNLDEEKFFDFFIFTILSHHNRENQIPDDDLIKQMVDWISKNFKFEVEYYYNPKNLLRNFNDSENRKLWSFYFPYRVKWVGTLMKCDYCASAGISPEEDYKGDYSSDFNNFITKKSFSLKDFQIQAGRDKKDSIILVASTGMGKTECAMNWISGEKAFYLLGIRTAVNEMYNRFVEVFNGNVNLLHGETSYFLAQTETDEDEYDIKIEKARKLSHPITIATADQIVTSVFKYPGFEFTYLTCSYSKIIVDEIQSFSPASIASIVVFLKEIHNLGGKFLLMTATLPPFIKDEFKELKGIKFYEPQLLDMNRHRITIIDENIESDALIKIIKKNSDKKVLIICNTIKKSQEIYSILKDYSPNLIHSHFIGIDRKDKEKSIMNAESPCIWISTQIVEASLDIDFDILITENASIEALLQRFGRCYRKREYNLKEPNIFIFKSEPYNIYDSYLFNKTWDTLQKYNGQLITEHQKQDIINEVFDNIVRTNYFQEYKNQKDLLSIGYRSLSKIQAQEDFRQITNNYVILPEKIFNDEKHYLSELLKFIDDKKISKLDRIKRQQEFFNFTIPIQLYNNLTKNLADVPNSNFCKTRQIKILKNTQYDSEIGLRFINTNENKNDNFIL